MSILEIIIQMFFLLAPAGMGNIAPVILNKLPLLKTWLTPLDFNLTIKDKRIFGKNKTWRGLLYGAILGGLTNILVFYMINSSSYLKNQMEFLNQGLIFMIILGIILGIFALTGDAIASFIKRQFNIKPGRPLPILDQIDYILGAYIVIMLLFNLSFMHYVWGLVIYGLIHPLMSNLGYILKLKRDRF